MVAEATHLRPANEYRSRAVAAMVAGQVVCLPNGRAAVKQGVNVAAIGDPVTLVDDGVNTVIKKSGEVWLDGCELWWDHSANVATCVPQFADKDFRLGCSVGDHTSAATAGVALLNVLPSYIVDMQKDGGDVVPVLTAGTPYAFNRGGAFEMGFSLTAEAQKLDFLSKRSFPVASNWIADFVAEIVTNADAAVAILSLGVANTSHASAPDSITESVLFHLDLGTDLNIDCESDDGTTEVAATDSTKDAVVGTPVLLTLDGRDESNVKFYINGEEVLAATANLGNIAVATGPLKLLAHWVKTSNDSPGIIRIHRGTVRIVNE